ncbi:MAG: hypothetical protein WBW44_04415 [Solirubrobacterales bacterium]
MGRLTWGSVIAVLFLLAMVPMAKAVEIPPTAKCKSTLKKQMDSNYKKYGPDISAKKNKKLTRLQAIELEEAGCISEALPLYKKVEIEPFTDQCRTAAQKADRYWKSSLRRLNKATRPFLKKVAKPHQRQIKRIKKRIDALRDQGRTDRAKALVSKRREINRKYRKRAKVAIAKIKPIYVDIGFDSALTFSELISLRCVRSDISQKEMKGTPAGKVLSRHIGIIFISMLFVLEKYGEFDSDSSGSSSRSTATTLDLPLFTLRR